MNKKDNDYWTPQIMEKQGGKYCMMCQCNELELAKLGRSTKFCIDHIDNNNNHNSLENLQFLCKSCNTKKNHPQNTEPYSRMATPEMSKGMMFESQFRNWVFGHFLAKPNLGYEYHALLNDGAEFVGCSQETLKRYLGKMTSKDGMYDWLNQDGVALLKLKDEYRGEVQDQ